MKLSWPLGSALHAHRPMDHLCHCRSRTDFFNGGMSAIGRFSARGRTIGREIRNLDDAGGER
jgi:hypothetical protein